jgi:hypothetical protein
VWTLCSIAKEKPTSLLLGDVDQVIPYGDHLLLVRYQPLKVYKWDPQQPTLQLQDVSIFLSGDFGQRTDPIYWTRGQSWNHLVVDRAQKYIWQLDSNLQVLSQLPVPNELEGLLEQYQVFWLKGRRVLFLNPTLGVGYQYILRHNGWWHRDTFRIPLEYNRCYLGFSTQQSSQNEMFICLSSRKAHIFDWEWNKDQEFIWEENEPIKILQSSHSFGRWNTSWELLFRSPDIVQYRLFIQETQKEAKRGQEVNTEEKKSLCYYKESRRVYLCL